MFGYNEDELVGRKVNIFMSPPYNNDHEHFITNYETTYESNVIESERKVYGMHKSGYVFPV